MQDIAARPRIGKVKSYSQASGYGFLIDQQSGQEIFVHRTGLVEPYIKPAAGTRVEFVLGKNDRGKLRALQVRSLEC
ncbi:MAG: cold shock domain-containing protein [Xanthobacteraceae bacterium]